MNRVCVLGLGYIGLPTASLLATKGFKVLGVDINERAVESINRGEIHIHEPDLDILVKSAVLSGNLTASGHPAEADVFVIAVPTPFTDGHSPDMSYVERATRSIANVLAPGNLVILESTSPVRSTERIAEILRSLRPDLDVPIRRSRFSETDGTPNRIYIAHCPERVLPGQILKELVDNDRIVGGIDYESAEKARGLYARFSNGEIVLTDSRTAELSKLAENAFRDVNIAFANELSFVCDELGIDVWELISLANRHPRVNILQPGPGVGGHCIAVDPWFIVDSAPEASRLIRTAREVNDSKPLRVVEKVRDRAARFREPVIACLGLSYKADIDDLRESPAVAITKTLAEERVGTVIACEPHIRTLPPELAKAGIELVPLEDALRKGDIIVVLVNHKLFLSVDRKDLQERIVIDTRGIWR